MLHQAAPEDPPGLNTVLVAARQPFEAETFPGRMSDPVLGSYPESVILAREMEEQGVLLNLFVSQVTLGIQNPFAFPTVSDERAVQRSGMIKAGDVASLWEERGVPRFEVVAEEYRDIFHRIGAEQTSCTWVDWDLRDFVTRREHQVAAMNPIIRSLPPAGTEMVPHCAGVIGK